MQICHKEDSKDIGVPDFVAGHVYKDARPVGGDVYYIAAVVNGRKELVSLCTGRVYSSRGGFGVTGEDFTDVTDRVCLKVKE